MVEADSHLKLHPPPILDIYKVFNKHIDMLFISIWWQPYTIIKPTLLCSDVGVLGHSCGVDSLSTASSTTSSVA